MFCFYSIYTGPQQSMLAYYTAAAVLVPKIDPVYEKFVPSRAHCWDRRKTFNNPCPDARVFCYSLDFNEVNSDEYLAVHRLKNKILDRTRAFSLVAEKTIYCKEVSRTAALWPERLAIIASVMHRYEIMDPMLRYRRWDVNMEKSKEAQLEVLKHLLVLDPIFKWEKCMRAFEHVYPKPAWFRKELISYKEIVGE